MPPPPADFSDSDQDAEDQEMGPEEDMGEDMRAMDGDEDLEEEDGLGKSCPTARPGFDLCHVT
jgi:anaphase-promoting complex subunit 10